MGLNLEISTLQKDLEKDISLDGITKKIEEFEFKMCQIKFEHSPQKK
jgi:hypothetical protein